MGRGPFSRGAPQRVGNADLYPFHNTLAVSEHLLGIAVFATPVAWATGNPILTYNIVFLASFVFAGASMFVLARELTGRTDAAIVAAFVFAFYPYHLAQAGHLQTMMTGWMALSLLGLHRYLANGSRKALAGAAAAYWFEAASNGYYLVFFGAALALVAAWGLWRADAVRRPRMAVEMVVAALAIGAGYAPIAHKYLDVRHRYDLFRPADDIVRFSADLGTYLTLPDAVRDHLGFSLPHDPKPGDPEERHDGMLFPGFVMLALAGVGVLAARVAQDPMHPQLEIGLPAYPAHGLRISQSGRADNAWWSIAELSLCAD